MARGETTLGAILLMALAASVVAQTAETQENQAVGQSLNYVFATDLGSGVYDLDGRTLQIYRFTYQKELREVDDDTARRALRAAAHLRLFRFLSARRVVRRNSDARRQFQSRSRPRARLSDCPTTGMSFPTRARRASIASSSIDGWLYGIGVRIERERSLARVGTASCAASSTSRVSAIGRTCAIRSVRAACARAST